MTDRLTTSPADKVTPAEFAAAAFGRTMDDIRADVRAECIQAIRRGDTYGFPPSLVEECQKLTDAVEADLRFTLEMQRKDAA